MPLAQPIVRSLVRPLARPLVAAASVPAEVSPDDFASLSMWYDFDDDATVTLSGSDIIQITDKSGNGRTMTPPVTAPTIAVEQQNGRNAGNGIGGGYLTATDAADATTGLTVMVAAARFSGSGPDYLISHYADAGNLRSWGLGCAQAGPSLMCRISADGGPTNFKNYTTGSVGTAWHVWEAVFDAGVLEIRLDGVSSAITKATDGTVASLFDSSVAFALFAQADGVGQFPCYIGEAHEHAAALSLADRDILVDRMKTRWAIV